MSFMQFELGFFDHETCRIESAENPFAAKVLLGLNGSGMDPRSQARPERFELPTLRFEA